MKAITFFPRQRKHRQGLYEGAAGFTMVELLVVVIMVSILAVIAGAGLQGWLNRQKVNAVQDITLNAIRNAQAQARQRNVTWQVSFKQTVDASNQKVVQWAVHPAPPAEVSTDCSKSSMQQYLPDADGSGKGKAFWQTIEQPGVEIDTGTNYTFPSVTGNPAFWCLQFDNKGNPVFDQSKGVPKITLSYKGINPKRCIKVLTLLGGLRSDGDADCAKAVQ